jgi:hypothetical protein
LNQARLYAIETRIQENEQAKMREVDFLKETMKKLIYAIEQSSISSVKQQQPPPKDTTSLGSQNLPILIKGTKGSSYRGASEKGGAYQGGDISAATSVGPSN